MTIYRDEFLSKSGERSPLDKGYANHRSRVGRDSLPKKENYYQLSNPLICISNLVTELSEFDELEDVMPRAISCLAPLFSVHSLTIIEAHNAQKSIRTWYHRATPLTYIREALVSARGNYRRLVDPEAEFRQEYTHPKLIALETEGLQEQREDRSENRLVIPLAVGNGVSFGILQIEPDRHLQDHDTAMTMLHVLANRIAVGIERVAFLHYQRKLLALQYSSNLKLSQLEQQRVEAIAASSAKSSFLANMSHEIRTPLGIILGFTELLGTSEVPVQERSVFQDSIRKNGQLLAKLIDDLLDLAKIEEGKIELEYKTFSLSEILDDIKTTFTSRAREKGLYFQVVRDPELEDTITSDPFRLKQILINIVNNALKFTDEGGITLHVHQNPQGSEYMNPADRIVRFEIRDTGVGISTDEEKGLFQPFKQANKSTARMYGGTGLGLVLARRLANALGGDVVLRESTPGVGSVFEVSISHLCAVVAKNSSDHHMEREPDKEPEFASGWTTLEGSSILIADDALDNLLLFSTVLRAHGAVVDTAHDGFEAVEMALKNSYDILLLDLQMPIKDGFTAAGELRSRGFTKPILALTAMAMAEERAKAIEAGCTDHLSKPVNAELLVQKIVKLARDYGQAHQA